MIVIDGDDEKENNEDLSPFQRQPKQQGAREVAARPPPLSRALQNAVDELSAHTRQKGGIILVVGATGTGKSTLVAELCAHLGVQPAALPSFTRGAAVVSHPSFGSPENALASLSSAGALRVPPQDGSEVIARSSCSISTTCLNLCPSLASAAVRPPEVFSSSAPRSFAMSRSMMRSTSVSNRVAACRAQQRASMAASVALSEWRTAGTSDDVRAAAERWRRH